MLKIQTTNIHSRDRRGFSLIELMMVVAIIGLLASVAIPSFTKYIQKSRASEALLQLRKVYDGAMLRAKTRETITQDGLDCTVAYIFGYFTGVSGDASGTSFETAPPKGNKRHTFYYVPGLPVAINNSGNECADSGGGEASSFGFLGA